MFNALANRISRLVTPVRVKKVNVNTRKSAQSAISKATKLLLKADNHYREASKFATQPGADEFVLGQLKQAEEREKQCLDILESIKFFFNKNEKYKKEKNRIFLKLFEVINEEAVQLKIKIDKLKGKGASDKS